MPHRPNHLAHFVASLTCWREFVATVNFLLRTALRTNRRPLERWRIKDLVGSDSAIIRNIGIRCSPGVINGSVWAIVTVPGVPPLGPDQNRERDLLVAAALEMAVNELRRPHRRSVVPSDPSLN